VAQMSPRMAHSSLSGRFHWRRLSGRCSKTQPLAGLVWPAASMRLGVTGGGFVRPPLSQSRPLVSSLLAGQTVACRAPFLLPAGRRQEEEVALTLLPVSLRSASLDWRPGAWLGRPVWARGERLRALPDARLLAARLAPGGPAARQPAAHRSLSGRRHAPALTTGDTRPRGKRRELCVLAKCRRAASVVGARRRARQPESRPVGAELMPG